MAVDAPRCPGLGSREGDQRKQTINLSHDPLHPLHRSRDHSVRFGAALRTAEQIVSRRRSFAFSILCQRQCCPDSGRIPIQNTPESVTINDKQPNFPD